QTPRCDAGRNTIEDTPPCCLRHLRVVLQETVRLLAAEQIECWADGGTLLGAVRDGAIIPWDNDGDLGIQAADVPRVLALAGTFKAVGFDVQTHCGGALVRINYSTANTMGVDIFPWAAQGEELVHPFKGRRSQSSLWPLSRVRLDGLELPAPADPEHWLEARYGLAWREPRRGVPERPGLQVWADPPAPVTRQGRGRRGARRRLVGRRWGRGSAGRRLGLGPGIATLRRDARLTRGGHRWWGRSPRPRRGPARRRWRG